MEKIEIVVPDLANNDPDPNKHKWYKYVVYSHTSCKCGDLKDRLLYGNVTNGECSLP